MVPDGYQSVGTQADLRLPVYQRPCCQGPALLSSEAGSISRARSESERTSALAGELCDRPGAAEVGRAVAMGSQANREPPVGQKKLQQGRVTTAKGRQEGERGTGSWAVPVAGSRATRADSASY